MRREGVGTLPDSDLRSGTDYTPVRPTITRLPILHTGTEDPRQFSNDNTSTFNRPFRHYVHVRSGRLTTSLSI